MESLLLFFRLALALFVLGIEVIAVVRVIDFIKEECG